jgi:hypothetical protein
MALIILTEKNSFATLQFSRFAPACRHTWSGSREAPAAIMSIALSRCWVLELSEGNHGSFKTEQE